MNSDAATFKSAQQPLALTVSRSWPSDYLELTKPRVTLLILMSTCVGFCLGSAGNLSLPLLAFTLLGTALAASGTAALNQFWERDADGKMLRTKDRPLPAGRMLPWKALWFGIALSLLGIVLLAWLTNFLAGLLAALTLGSLSVPVYSPENQNSALHFGRCISGSHTSADRMGGRAGRYLSGGVHTVLDAFSLAVSPLSGHSLDVSGRLRPGRDRDVAGN